MKNGHSTISRFLVLSAVTLSLMACGGSGSDDVGTNNRVPLSTFVVDSTVQPSVTKLRGFTVSDSRPLAALSDESGEIVEFISNELWVSTENDVALEELVARWNGVILQTINAETTQITGFPSQALVRVNVATADISNLADDIHSLSPERRSDLKVSSDAGLKLLAVSAQESRNGIIVGLNFVGKPSVLRDSYEAPIGEVFDTNVYDSNAFNWSYLNSGSTQDIGVIEAWRALDAAGRLTKGSVKLAILDMGFAPDSDFPEGGVALSNISFVAPIGTTNLIGCGNGNDCLWHGTNVVSAAMGVPGNNYGAAGPAGPVADPVLVFTGYDFATSISAIAMARIAGARIVNMSYSVPVPSILGFAVIPFDIATVAFRDLGDMLLFASAGNDNRNVDATYCFLGLCVEKTWITPCENSGVICIGGLAPDSKSRHPGSNYGGEDVDLFGPFTVLVGPDPKKPNNLAYKINGTSFSSPFVAGVAALIKAADPGLGANAIEDILINTAHSSSDDKVERYVNAGAAVYLALGNIAPNIEIYNPITNSDRQLNHSIRFGATANDFEDGHDCCDIIWTSNIDGVLSSSDGFFHTFITTGMRIITVSTKDSAGSPSSISFNLNIINTAPRVYINKPVMDEGIFRGTGYILRGSSNDQNEIDQSLPCDSMQWSSSNISDMLGSGCELAVTFLSNGSRTLTLTGTDSEGSMATDTVNIMVVEPPADLPPQVQITSPANGSLIPALDAPISLTATVSDDNDELTEMSYQWTMTLDNVTVQIGTEKNINWVPLDTMYFSQEGRYDIRLTLNVTDSADNTGTDFVVISTTIID